MADSKTLPPLVVLDTNVVLDWLVFRNPESNPLAAAIASGELRWMATAAMREELVHVLARGHLDTWAPDQAMVWTQWDRHCTELPAPAQGSLTARLRCSDADDQKFIDLALDCKAHWLLSRDRAVLKLARRLVQHGVRTLPPERWVLSDRV